MMRISGAHPVSLRVLSGSWTLPRTKTTEHKRRKLIPACLFIHRLAVLTCGDLTCLRIGGLFGGPVVIGFQELSAGSPGRLRFAIDRLSS